MFLSGSKISTMTARPGRESFSRSEWKLIGSLPTPARVQRFLTSMPYNWESEGGTLRSFREALKRREVHCLEAALVAAVILEQHGFPPLLLSLESQDKLDHVIFVFQVNSCWGAIGRSRDIGLHGRRAVFRRLRDLAWSYFAPYVDYSGRITGYGLGNLDALGNYDWRFSAKNLWKVENYLREIPHRSLKSSDERYENLLTRFKKFKKRYPDKSPAYFDDRSLWLR
jgi:hypothetical protein